MKKNSFIKISLIVACLTVFSYMQSQNVGIGTTSPLSKLHIRGQLRVDTLLSGVNTDSVLTVDNNGVFRRRNASFFNTNIYNADGILTGNRSLFMGANSLAFDTTTLFLNPSTNRIGIGTTSPGESLDVRGNVRIGNNDTSNYISFRGLSNDGAGTFDHTFIGERIYSKPESSELLIFKGNDTGNTSITPGPERIRLLAAEHRFDTYGAATSGNFESIASSLNNTNRMIIKNNGNVGIGTSDPINTMDINGTTRIRTLTSGAASDSIVTADANGVLRRRNITATINEPWFNVATNTGATANTQNIYQMGSVGIGTTVPNEKLDVDGNVRVGLLGTYSATATANYGKALMFGGAQGMFSTADGENSDPLWIARYNAASNNTELRVNIGDDVGTSGDKFVVGASVGTVTGFTGTTPYTPFFTVESTGNVGVGTTTPNASAIMDLSSTSKGIAIPRMTSAQRKAIVSPTIGLQVYDTDLKGIYVFDGTWDCLNVPAGTVQYAARNTPPRGYLEANGQAVDRTTYAELFTAIGTSFGAGNGTTTFNLPDLRGEFVRGWSNGRPGADFGRPFGSSQASDNLAHTHGINDPGHFHSFSTINDDFNNSGTNPPGFSADSAGNRSWDTNNKTTGITIQSSGGSESRPRNIALLPIIKF